MLRDWVQRKHASFDEIEKEIEASSNFYQKREAFSYWLFPEEDETVSFPTASRDFNAGVPTHIFPVARTGFKYPKHKKTHSRHVNTGKTEGEKYRTRSRAKIEEEIDGYEFEIQALQETRDDLKRRMDAPVRPSNWYQLENEYASTGKQMSAIIRKKRRVQAEQKKLSSGEVVFFVWLGLLALVFLGLFFLFTTSR